MRSSIIQWCAVAAVLAAPASASAQNWEVEAHGGVGFASSPTGGSGSVPGTGSASAATVSSWYFGDGALAVNQALALFRLSGQISSLDATLQSPFFQRNTGAAIGVRLARVLTPRFSVELSLDNAFGSLQATSASQAALGAANTSFISAWNALLSGPSRGTQTVTSTTSVNSGGGQRFITGGVVINLTSGNRVTPYATAGAGVIVNYGSASAQVNGTYQFQVVPLPIGSGPPAPTFHETDAVTVSASTTNAAVGVFGFGAKIASAGRWGVRIDARDYLSGNTVKTTVTAAPASQTSQPTGIFVLGTSPPLQFSTVSGTPSTLSQPVSSFTTFSGTGVRNQVLVTAGMFWRF